ncbi:hypothetical protein H2199_009128 [Coniosporium tulheliwenetii]|uniref:Uncharacterized protein n=1 Tax=Coniosporium tulheliwenetii TaxID=3383036 RepID=A0ACC2YFA0_9PEZI|nr:hypothetical protein H2199_009128 [Cladosporium sp. JES 115]
MDKHALYRALDAFKPCIRHLRSGHADVRPERIGAHAGEWQGSANTSDHEIVRSTIRQLYRDWSNEGANERNACHELVLQDLATESSSVSDKSSIRVLIPGAGLCRLVFNVAVTGYTTEGNEISYHQLLASHFILSYKMNTSHFELYPWALSFSNHLTRKPSFVSSRLSATTTDFSTGYTDSEHAALYDAAATVFFLDTASNLLRYIEVVYHCLKPGGIWINVGPLLWNCHENGPGGRREGDTDDDEACKARQAQLNKLQSDGHWDRKLEFTEDEVLLLLEHFGFKVEKHESCGEAGYIMDPKSMLQNTYRMSHWVARKL